MTFFKNKNVFIELYKSSNSDAENRQNIVKVLENLNIPQLTEELKLTCEGKISPSRAFKPTKLPEMTEFL